MSTPAVVVLVIAIIALAATAFVYLERRRSQRLRERFGPEYERTVTEIGDRRRAESELERRAQRVERFHIHAIPREQRDRFAQRWRAAQTRFVDEPDHAVDQAHGLVNEVMRARGYPVSAEFERNAEDLSANYPHVVEHYRLACQIGDRRANNRATTEDLRNAMTHYRELFEELLGSR